MAKYTILPGQDPLAMTSTYAPKVAVENYSRCLEFILENGQNLSLNSCLFKTLIKSIFHFVGYSMSWSLQI